MEKIDTGTDQLLVEKEKVMAEASERAQRARNTIQQKEELIK